MSENNQIQPTDSVDSETHLDVSSPPGSRLMGLFFGLPLLALMAGAMFYAAFTQKQPFYLLVGAIIAVIVIVVAKKLYWIPAEQSVPQEDHR